MNSRLRDSGLTEQESVGLEKINMMSCGHVPFSPRSCPGIDFFYREVQIPEEADDLLPYLEAFLADAGTYDSTQLPRLGSIFLMHLENHLLRNALDGTLPS